VTSRCGRPGNGTFYWGTSSSGFNDAAARAKQWGNKDLGDVPFLGDIDGDAIDDVCRLACEHRHVVLGDVGHRLTTTRSRIEAMGESESGRRADGR
jgi:hypothetical protein